MDIANKLLTYGKKNIPIDDLVSLLGQNQYDVEKCFRSITKIVDEKLVEPVLASGLNGNKRYPLYKKYRILLSREYDKGTMELVKTLHPLLLRSGYLQGHLDEAKNNREILLKLSAFFFLQDKGVYVSRKERSFELFGKEKILDDNQIKAFLRNLNLSNEELLFYDTPEYCFHDFIPVRKDIMTLLICENKDIWFNIRRRMFEDDLHQLFGVNIDGVVYGNGNKVAQKHGALNEYAKFMGSPQISFLYWGDIDREGFDIFRRTRKVNDGINISLFVPGYERMIARAQAMELEDSPSSRLENEDYSELLDVFTDKDQSFIRSVFDKNKLIPQEIISYKHLC